MDINIRLPSGQYITVKVEKTDTILILKEKICLTNILFIKDNFHLYLPGQEQSLNDEVALLSLPDVQFLQMIPDTLDASKLTYDAYSCERHNVTPIPSCNSPEIDNNITNFSDDISFNRSIRIYTSSTIHESITNILTSPIKPNVPSVPKAVMRKKSFKYKNMQHNTCILL